jgi:hypothetical protein
MIVLGPAYTPIERSSSGEGLMQANKTHAQPECPGSRSWNTATGSYGSRLELDVPLRFLDSINPKL